MIGGQIAKQENIYYKSRAVATYSNLEIDFPKKTGKQATLENNRECAFFTVTKDPYISVLMNASIFVFELWEKVVADLPWLVFTREI